MLGGAESGIEEAGAAVGADRAGAEAIRVALQPLGGGGHGQGGGGGHGQDLPPFKGSKMLSGTGATTL